MAAGEQLAAPAESSITILIDTERMVVHWTIVREDAQRALDYAERQLEYWQAQNAPPELV